MALPKFDFPKTEAGSSPVMLLTGASRGIGHATVMQFAMAGWRILSCSRQAFSEKCPWPSGADDHVPLDLGDPEDTMRGIADGHGVSIAQIALAWLLSKDQVSSILLGATKLHQLDDNLAAVNVKLSDDEIAAMEEISAQRRAYPGFFIDRIDQPIAHALGARPGAPYSPAKA